MDISHLREFVVLAQTGNFLEAAGMLFISQSSLSKHIKRLEAELGITLFYRTTRKVQLSEHGEMLLPYANQIIHLQDKFSDALMRSRENQPEFVDIGAIPALAPYNITDVMVDFKKKNPAYSLNITQTGSDDLKGLLRSGKIELAFLRETECPADDLERLPFSDDVLVAVAPLTHPLARYRAAPAGALEGEDLLLVEEGTMLYDLAADTCRAAGFAPRVAFPDHKLENLIDLAVKGMGVAVMMKRLAVFSAVPHVAIVEITPTVHTSISLAYVKDKALSPGAQKFLQCVEGTT